MTAQLYVGARLRTACAVLWLIHTYRMTPCVTTSSRTPESGAFATRGTTELSRVVNVGAYVLASESDSVFFTIIGPTGVTVSKAAVTSGPTLYRLTRCCVHAPVRHCSRRRSTQATESGPSWA